MHRYLLGESKPELEVINDEKYVRLKLEIINGKLEDNMSDISIWSEDDSYESSSESQ